ncbi:phosphopantetheine-binding protein [Vibrio sp. PP-XX7]
MLRRTYEAPEGEIETLLAGIWQVLLNVEQVGRHDSFFELGGHSLLAVQLIERLRQKGYQLAVKSLFTQPTLATLAASISGSHLSRDEDVDGQGSINEKESFNGKKVLMEKKVLMDKR